LSLALLPLSFVPILTSSIVAKRGHTNLSQPEGFALPATRASCLRGFTACPCRRRACRTNLCRRASRSALPFASRGAGPASYGRCHASASPKRSPSSGERDPTIAGLGSRVTRSRRARPPNARDGAVSPAPSPPAGGCVPWSTRRAVRPAPASAAPRRSTRSARQRSVVLGR
jgi:hypothetical protein